VHASQIIFLIGVAAALVVIAVYLLAIAYYLHYVSGRLVIILAAVGGVADKTEGLGPIAEEIAGDLIAGQHAIESCVQRLESRFGPAPEDVNPRAFSAG